MKLLPWLLIGIFLATPIVALDYYADVVFDVHPDGTVTIDGTTNHPLLSERTTDAFTSKEKSRWLLNITLPEHFSDYIFTVRLPQGAVLNYANGKPLTIGTENNHVVLKSYGENGTLNIIAQYTVTSTTKQYVLEVIASVIAAAAICGVLLIAYWHGKRRAKKQINNAKPLSLIDGLSQRQQEIISLLAHANGSLTQKQIETELGLPKASVSRNIESLRRKGLIEKQQAGMSNVVRLTKET